MPKKVVDTRIDIDKNYTGITFVVKNRECLKINVSLLENRRVKDVDVDAIITMRYINLETFEQGNIGGYIEDKILTFDNDFSNFGEGYYKYEIVIEDEEGTIITPSHYFEVKQSIGKVNIVLYQLQDREGNTLKDKNGNLLKVRR